ncbi:rhomboid-like protein [Streptomyces sp. ERV7]|uniref:rhomboid-like protein n=1 Tax=Streptomyces sp. ERV7 TaxID=1322334 RepID=UPI000AFB5D58|nr:rhomboid-like protein [Streptomyces sp. ERV7]
MHPERTRDHAGLLNGIPRQRPTAREETADETPEGGDIAKSPGPAGAPAGPPVRAWLRRAVQLLPTPTGTPFTFAYMLLLFTTSLYMELADPDTVRTLLEGSSTDVQHLTRTPVLVLLASALWIAGGISSPWAVGFVFILTALERRVGGLRTAGVFLLGHVVATLVTEVPVGVSVLAGRLPDSSLHRLDYGISFGLMASVGALAGLLPPLLRWPLLGVMAVLLVQDLLDMVDPLASWGHPTALLVGVLCWPVLRRADRRGSARRARERSAVAEGQVGSYVP